MVAVLVELPIARHDARISTGTGGCDGEGAGIEDITDELPAIDRGDAGVIKGAVIGQRGPDRHEIVVGQCAGAVQRAVNVEVVVIDQCAVIGERAVIGQRAVIGKLGIVDQCAVIGQGATTAILKCGVIGVSAATIDRPTVDDNDARGSLAVAIGNVDLCKGNLWCGKGD